LIAAFSILVYMNKYNLLIVTGILFMVFVPEVYQQTASVVLRPAYVDISDQSSRGAVLMKLTGYESVDARYRLYNGSSQYNCWNHVTGSYITTNSYSSGPLVTGNPVIESRFWIAYLRGNNNSTVASYRDRLGPDYTENYQSVSLPSAESITSAFNLTGKLIASSIYSIDYKYIILAWSANTPVSASHSDPVTGDFIVVCPSGTAIDKIEARTLTDEICGTIYGSWTETSEAGQIELTDVLKAESNKLKERAVVFYPVPAGEYLNVSGLSDKTEIELYNLAGVKIMQIGNVEFLEMRIYIGHLASGVYFLKVKGVSGIEFYRFVKM